MGDADVYVDVHVKTNLEKYTSDEDAIKSYMKLKESSNYAADFKKNKRETANL